MDEIEIDIECSICFVQYSTATNDIRNPKTLQCGHTFCLNCLKQKFESNEGMFKCPFDNSAIRIGNLDQLAVNESFTSIIDNFARKKQELIVEYQNKQQKLLEEIAVDLSETKNQLIDVSDKLMTHTHSHFSVICKVNETIKELESMKNKDTEKLFSLDEYKQFEVYLTQLKKDQEFYKKRQQQVGSKLAHLNMIEAKFGSVNNLGRLGNNLERLVEFYIFISRLKAYLNVILAENQIKRNPEGLENLFQIEANFNKKLEQLKERFDLNQLLHHIKEFAEKRRRVFRIGVLGAMNVGKSSMINRLRNIKDTDQESGAAPVNIDECSTNIVEYEWKDNEKIIFVDYPGYASIDINDYMKKYLSIKPCDFYIILYNRLEENDIALAKYIFNSLQKQFLICRTHTDNHIKQIIKNADEQGKKLDDEEAKKIYKEQTLKVLNREKYSRHFEDATFTRNLCQERTLFISCDRDNYKNYEWKSFNEKLIQLADKDLAENFAEFSPFVAGKKIIRKKREVLEKNIKTLAYVSAATDLIPLAGILIDIGIILGEVTRYRNLFGLTQDNFKNMADLFKVKLEEREAIKRIIGIDSFYVNIKNLVSLALTGAASYSIPSGIQTLGLFGGKTIFGISPLTCVIGFVTAPVSYTLTKKVLTSILCRMEFDSFRLIDFLEKKIKVGESDFSYIIQETNQNQNESNTSEKKCSKCQKAGDFIKVMAMPKRTLPKKQRVCDKCFLLNDFNSNQDKMVFKLDKDKCMMNNCDKGFNWLCRKYHCEKCGSCVCYDHSQNELEFSNIYIEAESVCDECYDKEVNIK